MEEVVILCDSIFLITFKVHSRNISSVVLLVVYLLTVGEAGEPG